MTDTHTEAKPAVAVAAAASAPVTDIANPLGRETPVPAAETTLVPEWLSQFPDDLKNDATLQRYKTVDELAKGHIEAHKVAKLKVVLPNADDPESFQRFAAAVRPEDASAYQIDVPEGMPTDFADAMRPVFFEAGLLPQQVEALTKANNAFQAEQMAAYEQKGRDELDAMRQEMGPQDFERSKQAAVHMLNRMGIDPQFDRDLQRFVGGGNSLRLLFNLADRMGEMGKVHDTDVQMAIGNMKPEQALDAAREMQKNDKEGRLRDPKSSEYKRYQSLVALADKKTS